MSKKENKKKQRAIYLYDDIYDEVVQKAKKEGRSFANHVEVLVKKDLESNKTFG